MDLTQMEKSLTVQNISTVDCCRNCGKADKMDMASYRRGSGFESKSSHRIDHKTKTVITARTRTAMHCRGDTSVAKDVVKKLNRHSDVTVARGGNRCYGAASVISISANSHRAVCLVQSVIVTLFLLITLTTDLSSAAPELLQKQYSSSVYSSLSEQSNNNNDDNPDSAPQAGEQQPSLLPQLYRPLASVSACNVQCKTAKARRFCASDGKTYSSKCEIRRVSKCENKEIHFVSKGSCNDGREKTIGRERVSSNCHQALRKIERALEPSEEEVYRPVCHDNGTYRAVQCYHGYCWCVQSDGTPIPSTSTKDGQPDCNKQSEDSRKKKRGAVSSKKCTRSDRELFNYKLVRTFIADFNRLPQAHGKYKSGSEEKLAIIEWKYKELDKNQDHVLDGQEIKTLNRLVRNELRPKKCAKRFPNYCDKNKDNSITEEEWTACLDATPTPAHNSRVNEGGQSGGSLSGGNAPSSPRLHSNPAPARLPSNGDDIHQSAMSFLALLGGANNGERITNRNRERIPQISPESPNFMPATDPSAGPPEDCLEERRQAEENDRNSPSGQIFVPECVDGLFKKAQCHKFTGYCWCVDENTGVPIPGYSTLNETPDCSQAKPQRTMKGCLAPQKKQFLTQVLDSLSTDMANSQDPQHISKIPMDPDLSLTERAVRWKFAVLDTNSNSELSRKETKDVKDLFTGTTAGQPNLRKCARNFLRFCDANDDTRVTMEEWVACLQQPEAPSDSERESAPRKGQNPITTYLKS